MKLELNNPQKLALLLEFLKDIQYIKAIKVIQENKIIEEKEINEQPLLIDTSNAPKGKKPAKKRFNYLQLDTTNFKFNREELNER